ncbi:group II intron reverse transcriptase/maturase [Alkalihalobacillus sp. MEB130]|uniref:group II intron reverse transcriptase/maturase n=1 Tax=Alkalihalobacillus sp. MEB130 TaxID=2976704 RepID=UPI0037BEDC05
MFDTLYKLSSEGEIFTNLYKLVVHPANVKLAFRNIKRNQGSKTSGINNNTIFEIGLRSPGTLVKYVENRLENFKPHKVRRKEIPKPNGGVRPLGIPTIEDRLIQQCLKQILEPICEAKFHKHSYGFRPNRGTLHAFSRAVTLANRNKLHYVVDVDIKGFFDNVDHGKLLKQLWSLGIRDKRILSIISKLLKAEIKGIGKPTKGTPQGGIVSPLLSNVVLNEFDWWVSNQWETFKTKKDYMRDRIISGKLRKDQSMKYRELKRTSNLKEMFFVRYADDFKIFCRDHQTAFTVFEAVKKWLKERLSLEISHEKSKVVNLRKNYSEFLGYKFKVIQKGKKRVVKSHMSDKAKRKIVVKIKIKLESIRRLQKKAEVTKYNSTILGFHNYYRQATEAVKDFSEIAYSVKRILYNKLKKVRSKNGVVTKFHQTAYKDYLGKKKIFACGLALFPLDGVKHKKPVNFTQEKNSYTAEGRVLIHNSQEAVPSFMVHYLMENPIKSQSMEYNDNRLSKYIAQMGKCGITGSELEIGNMELHHKKPKAKGGKDSYHNLLFITKDIHKLIHAVNDQTVRKYFLKLKLNGDQLSKVNDLRKRIGNCVIDNVTSN